MTVGSISRIADLGDSFPKCLDPPRLRLPFTLSSVFSFSYVTSLIRIGYPQTHISMESLLNYLDDGEYIYF